MSTLNSSSSRGMVQESSLPGAVPEDSGGFMGVVPEPKPPVIHASGGAASAAKKVLVAPMSLTARAMVPEGPRLLPPVPPPSKTIDIREEWANFDGDWGKARISGKCLIFSNGDQAQLAFPKCRAIQVLWQGRTYEGELQYDGQLHWCDGEVWVRRSQFGAKTYPGEVGSPCQFAYLQSSQTQQWLPPAPPG